MMRTKPNKRNINGVVLINKPAGLTSNAVLQRVKHHYLAKKAGHTGSLDPIATGMLPVCLGEATKFSQYGLNADKTYVCTGVLGIKTTTSDHTGEVTQRVDAFDVSESQLREVLHAFEGESRQVPSMYSALKHQGKPLYALAREGITVERAARPIHIRQLDLLNFDGQTFRLRITCSKGTYIRNLVEDIGEHLGVGAHVTQLHRESLGGFENDTMHPLETIQSCTLETSESYLLPVDTFLRDIPICTLTHEQVRHLQQGRVLHLEDGALLLGDVRLYDEAAHFVGLGVIEAPCQIRVKRLLSTVP